MVKLGKLAPPPTASQRNAEVAGVRYWEGSLPQQPLPTRARDGSLVFPDYPDFRPNLTPDEVLGAGAFGGGYFRSIYSRTCGRSFGAKVHEELPPSWFKDLDVSKYVTSAVYTVQVNRYAVNSGNSLDFWENKGWMRKQDPYGWFQWYCRFFLGRRTEDDARQVARWTAAIGPKGRWRSYLVGQCVRANKRWDDPTASPVTRQTLLHWGFRLRKADYDALAPAISSGKSVIYLGVVSSRARAPGKSKTKPSSQMLKRPSARQVRVLKKPARAR